MKPKPKYPRVPAHTGHVISDLPLWAQVHIERLRKWGQEGWNTVKARDEAEAAEFKRAQECFEAQMARSMEECRVASERYNHP